VTGTCKGSLSCRRASLLCCQFFLFLLVGVLSAQQGTAPNNYYPAGYSGSTFTGKVVQTTDDTITLSYSHGNKTDTFEAYATAQCDLPSTKTVTRPMPLSQVQLGAVVTVFYQPITSKVNGKKQKRNQVIGILFQQVNGRQVAEEHQAIFFCVPKPFQSYFMAFQ